MSNSPNPRKVPLDELRESVACALAGATKSYELPAIAARLGLAGGSGDEAYRSKRLYVRSRILQFSEAELLKLAQEVLKEFSDSALADRVSEMTIHATHRISEITRRDVLKALNPLETLFGDTPLFDGLNIVAGDEIRNEADKDAFGFATRAGQIRRHYQRNPNWSHEELLIECGALSCSQARFCRLLEHLVHPLVRRDTEQVQLARALNQILEADSFRLAIAGEESRRPIYRLERIIPGVSGKPKNLIFAAIKTKPDLYFLDAINNDIAVRNVSDALIYDEFVEAHGLRWERLVQWWQAQQGLENPEQAQRNLYRRLLQSVKATGSPGQFALFDTYFRELRASLGQELPALIPEVYLHYDPLTLRERGAEAVLARQRMDFLLLLDHQVRIVIEIDGSQHYAESGRAAPEKYAHMVQEDRRLRLAGYELYRFGAAEFADTALVGEKITVGPQSRALVVKFFARLWHKHPLKA